MPQFLSNVEVIEQASIASGKRLEVGFEYEPIFWSRTNQVLAYEQLARRPGDFDASFLSELSVEQRGRLDRQAVGIAQTAQATLGSPVFINAFSENVETLARRLKFSAAESRAQVGLEVNEDVPLPQLLDMIQRFPEIWWIIDDMDVRKDSFDTVAHPLLRQLPLTVKFHFQSTIHNDNHYFDLGMLPSNWMVILEGVKPDRLATVRDRGISFIQGRDLGQKVRDAAARTVII